MSLNKDVKSKIIKDFAKSSKDTGSCEIQVALLSKRIKKVANHLKSFPKDYHSRLGLLKMVGKRKAFLRYLGKRNESQHDQLVATLKEGGYI